MSRRAMATGHHVLDYPLDVCDSLVGWLRQTGISLFDTGGCEGADTVAAKAAWIAEVPFRVSFPNWAYRDMYPRSIPDRLLRQAADVRYVIERPNSDDWRRRWRTEKWWVDNFRRNDAMGADAHEAVVISPRHPADVAGDERGGTAHCIRSLISQGFQEVVWVQDAEGAPVSRVVLVNQCGLFDRRSITSRAG